MTATRVERKKPEKDPRRVTQPLPVPEDKTRIKAPGTSPGPRKGLTAPERIALFAHALVKDRARGMLESLSGEGRERALHYLDVLAQLPSSERQGRLSTEFGIRPEANTRLRELWAAAGPALKVELFKLLPPYHRSLFPDFVPDEALVADAAPALKAFAERLVREATR